MRVHTRISREPWARLWYLCRALDSEGSGRVMLPVPLIEAFLDCSDKSIYRWLQDGKKTGAFRHYRIKKGTITVYLGAMFNVSYQLNLRRWGAVGVCSLGQVITQLRSLTTGLVTQRLQQKSRYAASHQVLPEFKKFYGTPHPNELVKDIGQSSHKSPEGEVPGVLHISSSRVFVFKNFLHYGTSQNAVSKELGIHTRTVRRHQRQLGMSRRQLCQAKLEYHQLKFALDNEAPECWAFLGTKTDVGYQVTGDTVVFSDGVVLGAKKQQPNIYQTDAAEFKGRFFKVGNKVFMARCNIYREVFTLTTMAAAQKKYRMQLSQCQFDEKRAVAGSERFHNCSGEGGI